MEMTHLVGLDGCNLLILLYVVTNLLRPLLQCTLRNGLGHFGYLDNLVGIVAELLDDRDRVES